MIKNKKGLSAVITAIMMILLVMISVGIVWTVVESFVKKGMEGTVCSDVLGKVEIYDMYTCYNSTNNSMQFSILRKDINISGVVVKISGEGNLKPYDISEKDESVVGLKNYTWGNKVKIPEKNGASTYRAEGYLTKPESIEVAPIINEKTCEVVDVLYEIETCFGS